MKPRFIRGFTLVELVTSIIIIGILAAVVGPKFFGNNVFSERGYADEVAAALRYSQAVAVSSGCEVSITFDAVGYQARQRDAVPAAALQPPCAIAGDWVTPVVRVDGGALAGTYPSGVTLTPTTLAGVALALPTQIVFDAQGQVANGLPPLLQIGNATQPANFTLSIDAFSGFVVVQ